MTRAEDISQEIKEVAPQLPPHVGTPYSAPAGYFDTLADFILMRIRTEGMESASDEINIVSPLLGKLNRNTPYTIPEGYFERLPATVQIAENRKEAKIVAFGARNVFQYAVAAATIVFISLAALFYFKDGGDPQKDFVVADDSAAEVQVKERIGSISDNEIADFVDGGSMVYYFDNAAVAGELAEADLQLMFSDVPDEELERYLNMNKPAKEIFN